ncbi:MAG: response regulator transcription factor [Clostridiales bacterium]|nr:response regulator transcription factor [Clostridiales bacterium]
MSHILIIEDERTIADIIVFNLEKEGFSTTVAADGEEGLRLSLRDGIDLILLDVMLPLMDGWTLLCELRKTRSTPVIMLTAREEELDKIHGLELGADDYITKPFSMNELKARIRANLRRVGYAVQDRPRRSAVKGLTVNPGLMQVQREGEVVDLSAREYALLTLLMENPGRVFSREELLSQVWEFDGFLGDLRVVDVMVRRLREKIERDPSAPEILLTRRGAGYFIDGGAQST